MHESPHQLLQDIRHHLKKVPHFRKNNQKYNYKMDDTQLNGSTMDLGVLADDRHSTRL